MVRCCEGKCNSCHGSRASRDQWPFCAFECLITFCHRKQVDCYLLLILLCQICGWLKCIQLNAYGIITLVGMKHWTIVHLVFLLPTWAKPLCSQMSVKLVHFFSYLMSRVPRNHGLFWDNLCGVFWHNNIKPASVFLPSDSSRDMEHLHDWRRVIPPHLRFSLCQSDNSASGKKTEPRGREKGGGVRGRVRMRMILSLFSWQNPTAE